MSHLESEAEAVVHLNGGQPQFVRRPAVSLGGGISGKPVRSTVSSRR